MKQKYLYENNGFYRIVYHKYYVMGDYNKKKVMNAYKKCENAGWNMTQLRQIHDIYKKYKKQDEGIYPNETGYIVYVNAAGRRRYCGRYKTLNEARKIKKQILKDPSYDPVKHRKHRRTSPTHPDRYIRKRHGRYEIVYNRQGWGTFKTIEEARKERDLLVKCGWDYSELEGQE
jgi:hypothetical protein